MTTTNVTEARFRPATPEEVNYAKGNLAWRTVTGAWNGYVKTWATVDLGFQMKVLKKDVNPYVWKAPLPLRLAHNVKWYCNLAPERGFLETVTNWIGTWHLINCERKVFEAFFAPNRNSDVFKGSQAFHALLALIGRTFPETKFSPEDFMFTSSPEKNAVLHKLVQKFVAGSYVENHVEYIRKLSRETLQHWSKQEKVNVTEQCRIFASKVISTLLFGMEKNSEEVAGAVNFINAYILRRELRKQWPDDEQNILKALGAFKNAVDEVLSADNAPLFEGQDHLTPAEKQAMAFSLFFAGQETVAALMTYMIYMLGKEPETQWALVGKILMAKMNGQKDIAKQPFMKEFFARAIKEFPPAYGVSKIAAVDTCLEYKTADGIEHKHIIYAGERITAMMSNYAKVVDKVNEAAVPYFGLGPHRCPGEKLAVTEILEFIGIAVEEFALTTLNPHSIPFQGLITLQLQEDVMSKVAERKQPPVITISE